MMRSSIIVISLIMVGCQMSQEPLTRITIKDIGKDSVGCFVVDQNNSKIYPDDINAVSKDGSKPDFCSITTSDVGRQILVMKGVR